jgi:cytoskeleton protein RodZ
MDDKNGTYQMPNGDAKIGQALEKARQARGLSLDEVEHATKIRKRYLAGLEREDYRMLPDAVYIQGFLKTYANYLGLDGEELSRELKNRRAPRRERGIAHGAPKTSDFDRPLINPGELSSSRGRMSVPETRVLLALLIALLALAGVVATFYFVGRGVQLANDNPTPSKGEQAANPSKPGGKPDGKPDGKADGSNPRAGGAPEKEQPSSDRAREKAASQPDTLTVEVSVQGTASWLSILADGNLVYEQIAQPGFSQTFKAQREITIRTGNAGAVGVEVNGQDLGKLGGSGEVLTRKFTLKSAT